MHNHVNDNVCILMSGLFFYKQCFSSCAIFSNYFSEMAHFFLIVFSQHVFFLFLMTMKTIFFSPFFAFIFSCVFCMFFLTIIFSRVFSCFFQMFFFAFFQYRRICDEIKAVQQIAKNRWILSDSSIHQFSVFSDSFFRAICFFNIWCFFFLRGFFKPFFLEMALFLTVFSSHVFFKKFYRQWK